eukprot:scaffold9563_cov150-Skeletonema_marinoi.AAC.4
MKLRTSLLLIAWASSQCYTAAAYVAPLTSRRRLCTSFKNSASDDVDATIDSNDTKQYRDLKNHYSTGSRRDFFQRSANIFAVASTATTSAFLSTGSSTVANAALLSSSSSSLPPLNTPAPDFELPNSRNNNDGSPTTSLTSLLNTKKWTVLYFYPGAFTSGCTLEARNFQTDLPTYQNLNAQIVGVSVDSVEKNSEFCSAEKLEYTLLTDEGGHVSKLYGSSLSIPGFGTFSNRQTYIIDPRGDVRWVFVDVDSKIPRHSGDVLEKLRQLQE